MNIVSGIFDTDDQEISHKNLRYSAYRSLYIWLWYCVSWFSWKFNVLLLVKGKEKIQLGHPCPVVL